MKVIGLTGGIGSGKSTVAEFFKELNVPIYVSDIEAKKIMHKNPSVVASVKKLFGEEAYLEGQLNRKYIAGIVFQDKSKLSALNAIVHPAVHNDFQEFCLHQKAEYVVYESALLFENKSESQFDAVVLVVAPLELKIERIQKRDGATREEIEDRIQNQLSDEIKMTKTDIILHNIDIEKMKAEVQKLHNTFRM